jgi:3-phenylpropionate/trans-cinnamate dioxygenase ferredoxin component
MSEAWKDLGPADIAPGAHRGVQLGPEEFVLLVNLDGVYHAIDDWCNHAGCLLSQGPLEGENIVCHCHYAEFNVKTGSLITQPRICEDQARYELRIENERVLGLRLPEPASRF